MKNKNKEILRIQPLYSIIIWFAVSVCGAVMTVLPSVFLWESRILFAQVSYYIISAVFIALGVLAALRYMEYAAIDGGKITVRSPFGKILSLKNDEIKAIKIKKLTTYNSRGNVSLMWIVVEKDNSILTSGGLNKRNDNYCCIIASEKNISILKRFADCYHIPFE